MSPITGLAEAVGADSARSVYLVGAGGKTSLMYALATELACRGRRVVTTTSTRILRPPRELETSSALIVDPSIDSVIRRLADPAWRHRTLAASRHARSWKLVGHATSDLDLLAASEVADHVLVEADGAAGRPLKAHRDGEPVIGARCDRVVAVVSLACLGRPLDERSVHRPGIAAELAGVRLGAPITPALVTDLLLAPGGWFSRLPATAPVTILLACAGSAAAGPAAALAARLAAHATADRLAVAELRGRQRFVRSV